MPIDERPRAARRVALAALVPVLLAAMATTAHAEWDVGTFIKLRDEAQTLYDKGNYQNALPRYRVLVSMIEEALANDEIPENQQQPAREGLEVVRYQIGRSEQGLEECRDALATYEALARDATTASVQAKVAARLPETRLCLAQQALAASDPEAALAHARAAHSALTSLPMPESVAADDAELIVTTTEIVTAGVLEVQSAVLSSRVEATRAEIAATRCAEARQGVERSRELVLDDSQGDEVDALESEVEALCERLAAETAAEAAAAAAAAETYEVPLGPVITLGIGAAVLIGDGVFEGVVAADHVDRLDQAQQDCRSSGMRCDEVLSLKDSVETDQIISIALLGAGGAAVLGGAIWWVVDATLDDGAGDELSSPEASAFVSPQPGGAVLGLTWRPQ